jgi:hypothetical protein
VDIERAAVAVDDDRTRNGQALARALAHFLGREEGVENLVEVVGLDATTIVFEADVQLTASVAGGDPDPTARHVLAHRLDGMRGIDQQIEKDLVQFADVAGDERQRREVQIDDRQVFVFTALFRSAELRASEFGWENSFMARTMLVTRFKPSRVRCIAFGSSVSR